MVADPPHDMSSLDLVVVAMLTILIKSIVVVKDEAEEISRTFFRIHKRMMLARNMISVHYENYIGYDTTYKGLH